MVAFVRRCLAFLGIVIAILAPASLALAPKAELALWRASIFGKMGTLLEPFARVQGAVESPVWGLPAELALTVLAAAIISLLVASGRVRIGAAVTVVVIGAFVAGAVSLCITRHLLVDPVTTSILVLFAFAISSLMRLAACGLGAAQPLASGRAGDAERREVSVLVCEIRDLALLTEIYRDHPASLTGLINKTITTAADIVRAHRGTIEEIGPSGLLAVFNAAEANARHAEKATEAALAILSRLDPLNDALEKQLAPLGVGFQPVNFSIGVDTGEVIIGDVGLKTRRDLSIFGPAVDGAVELAFLAKSYGPAILIGDATETCVNRHFALLEMDLRETPKFGARPFYALLGNPVVRVSPRFKALQEGFSAFHSAYRGGNWDQAMQLLGQCAKLPGVSPRLVALYGDRLSYLSTHYSAEEWSGVLREIK